MHALIVVSHPNAASLTHAVATQIAQSVSQSGGNSNEVADIAAEGFDPRFTPNDLAVNLREAEPAADVLAEQARINRADALVLVYPVYWWTMPALLKGWIDRVFTNGWAYEYGADGLVKKMQRLPVHLVGIGGADAGTYERHGYGPAMKKQIDHGIFDYCGARVAMSELLLDSHGENAGAHLAAARAMGRDLFSVKPANKEEEAIG